MATMPNNYAEFDVARKRAQQAETANVQGQKDAIARRAAQLGGGPRGALMKQERLTEDASAKRLQAANENIDAAEIGEKRRIAEIESGRDFARSERLGSQDFSRGERIGSQEYASKENIENQKFARKERQASEKWNYEQADANRALQKSQFKDQMNFSKEQFDWEKYIDEKNLALAARIQKGNEKTGFLDGLLEDPIGSVTGVVGGGSVVCTEYHRVGWISDEIYAGCNEYGNADENKEAKYNYLAWAPTLVTFMQHYPILLWLLWPIFYNWTHQMAYVTGKIKDKPIFGHFVLEVLSKPTSNFVGSTIRKFKRGKICQA